MIPDLLSAFPHRQFHTLPGLLDSWAALPNCYGYRNACMPMQGGNLYHFYDGLMYVPAERRTHDFPCEKRTRLMDLTACQPIWVMPKRTMEKCVKNITPSVDVNLHISGASKLASTYFTLFYRSVHLLYTGIVRFKVCIGDLTNGNVLI